MAEGLATAEKLHVMAAPGCDCASCTFIRNAYSCRCPHCRQGWQAAFATSAAAAEAMAVHTQECLARIARRQAEAMRLKRPRRPRPTYYPVRCGWCGESWPQRFTTKKAGERFLLTHTRGCYLQARQAQQESA